MMTKAKKLPICLVTGFLGSGKTTLLKQIAQKEKARKIVFLVNEFSPHDIDGAMVSAENPNVISIPGGSIFCKCLVTEFIGRLQAIPEQHTDAVGVVIEASGMANPKVIGDMLAETRLDTQYDLAHIISVVDPASFLKLCAVLPNIKAQIEACDTALINKTDLHARDRIRATTEAVKDINPLAAITPCVNADTDIDLFGPTTPRAPLHGDYAKCKDPNYETLNLHLTTPIEKDHLLKKLASASEDLYRAKGDISTPEGRFHLEHTASGTILSPASPDTTDALVLIMKANPSANVRSLIGWLMPCPPKHPAKDGA